MRKSRAGAAVALILSLAGCRGEVFTKYEYEEELYLSLDGAATMYVHASVPALMALRGVELDVNPRARLDRERIRALFTSSATRVKGRITTSRRDGRLFVHVRVDVDDVRALPTAAPFAWSRYRFDRRGDLFVFDQTVGAAAARDVGNAGWDGSEVAGFRVHMPSNIPSHNAAALRRGNILVWEQPLADRLAGRPLHMEAHIETDSILYRTLYLFAFCLVAVILTFVAIIWWVMRKGRTPAPSEA